MIAPEVGWAGFYAATAAAILSYFPQRAKTGQTGDGAVLTRVMLESRDHGYERALASFQKGEWVFFDGLWFATQPDGQLVLTFVASLPAAELDELRAQQDAEQARAMFDGIAWLSPEIGTIAAERSICVSLLSSYGAKGAEICRVKDGQVKWTHKS